MVEIEEVVDGLVAVVAVGRGGSRLGGGVAERSSSQGGGAGGAEVWVGWD